MMPNLSLKHDLQGIRSKSSFSYSVDTWSTTLQQLLHNVELLYGDGEYRARNR